MSGLVSNPSSLTKDKLKRELEEHNIDFPSDAKKDVYVQLYKKHLLSEKSKLEFSSADETEIPSTPQKQRKKKPSTPGRKSPKKGDTKNMGVADVTALSDEELSSMLKANGIDCGPILETTRRVYQKKLERVLSQSVKAEPHVNHTQPISIRAEGRRLEEYSDTDETDAIPVAPVSSSPRKRPSTATTRVKPEVKQEVKKEEPMPVRRQSSRVTRQKEEFNDVQTRQAPPSQQPAQIKKQTKEETAKPKSALTWAAQITILVIVAIIVWILIQKMETAKKTPIREIP